MDDNDTFALLEESLSATDVPPQPASIAETVHEHVNRELVVSQSLNFVTGALPYAGQHLMPAVLEWLRLTCGGKFERRGRH